MRMYSFSAIAQKNYNVQLEPFIQQWPRSKSWERRYFHSKKQWFLNAYRKPHRFLELVDYSFTV